ncbi:Arf-GAP domain-containing protein [Favolaschia claudopus]|uniref:Arf-GAP domain-containing protein n=1 Tax=Favolaschia claudopus TaxID=2862362 RepID=A0AAW0EL73_9AGAR
MSRQDKATTDRFTRTLRELVKRADNKVCADCKRNDPRWASWNLGVFLCIRCSGIHRGMGTHISKVKSVDLDTWTPEQMQSIQKWGNRLANLYWEAHLKQGHQPPDHKMESFIRSKYESRRWALDGPPPPDPSVLDSEAGASTEANAEAAPAPPTAPDPIGWGTPSPPHASNSTVSKQPQPRQLLSAGHAPNTRTTAPLVKPPPGQHAASAPAPAPAPPAPQEDLFSLDFHAPAAPASPPPAPKNAKQDILSLFSTPAAAAPQMAAPPFGQFQQQPSPWGQQQPAQMQTQSMMGSNGIGMWGASSGWSAPQQAPQQQSNLWGAPAQQQSPFGSVPDTNNVWGGMVSAGGGSGNGNGDLFSTPAAPPPQKKDDAFGDLWGGFK